MIGMVIVLPKVLKICVFSEETCLGSTNLALWLLFTQFDIAMLNLHAQKLSTDANHVASSAGSSDAKDPAAELNLYDARLSVKPIARLDLRRSNLGCVPVSK
jgi:hypothetical protein